MTLAPEGRSILAWGAGVTAITWALAAAIGGNYLNLTAGCITLFFGLLLVFFRDPRRSPPEDPACIVSAGDGTVVAIEPVDHAEFLNGPGTQVSIFLTVFDVHVNRVPMPGVVELVEHRAGKFHVAISRRASLENEQVVIGIRDGSRRILVRQIAGLLARRIVCHLSEGETVERGQRFGIIKFGSRLDIVVPPEVTLQVRKGQRVTGGQTIIGSFSDEQ